MSDISAYLAIQETAWDETMAAAESKLAERFEIFPKGLLVAERDGQVVGCATFIRIEGYDEIRSRAIEAARRVTSD